MAVVQYTFTHKQYIGARGLCFKFIVYLDDAKDINLEKMIYDIFFNCNCVDTRWQQYSTHLHTNNTQNNTVYTNNTQNNTIDT